MQTSRRGFFGLVAAAATIPLASEAGALVKVVGPSTPCDLAGASLLDAMGLVGVGPYTLRVHAEALPYARSLLCRLFPQDDWRRDFTLVASGWNDLDSWALHASETTYYSPGG
jgi:hypothetical protein